MQWVEFRLQTAATKADELADQLIHLAHGGVVVEPAIETTPGSEEYTLPDLPSTVLFYLPNDDDLLARRDLLLEVTAPYGVLTELQVDEADWANAWKHHFKPLRVGRHLVIKPSWEQFNPNPGDVVVEIDPGMAFGTGDHPTTMSCLLALEQTLRSGDRVVDLGTGSGVLAVAAAKLGAARVLALDTDSVAVAAAQENCIRNGVEDRVAVHAGSIDAAAVAAWGQADLLLANLTSPLHQQLAPALVGAVAHGGGIIASGIGAPAIRRVTGAYRRAGAHAIHIRRYDAWRTLIIRVS